MFFLMICYLYRIVKCYKAYLAGRAGEHRLSQIIRYIHIHISGATWRRSGYFRREVKKRIGALFTWKSVHVAVISIFPKVVFLSLTSLGTS